MRTPKQIEAAAVQARKNPGYTLAVRTAMLDHLRAEWLAATREIDARGPYAYRITTQEANGRQETWYRTPEAFEWDMRTKARQITSYSTP
jgi:hypothetical protein